VPTAATAPTAAPASTGAPNAEIAPWSLVAVGDSIAFNSPDDCHGCTGFVDRYAAAIVAATGHPVKVQNLSQHNGLQIDGLLQELKTDAKRRDALANADIIVVGIAHNDPAWGRDDDPCDGPNGDNPDWSKYNATCAVAAAEMFRPKFESVYAQIVALRAGKPTIFRTINRYNDWIGGDGVGAEGANATRLVLDAWSAMLCTAAQTNGFTCADIYHAFNGPDGLTPAVDLLARDFTHPSDKGNAVIARVLAALGYAPLADTHSSITVTAIPSAQPAATEASIPTSAAAIQFVGHTDRLWQATFSPDGKQVVTASADNTARIWDVATGKELLRISGHTDEVRGAIFSADGKQILTASNDTTARTWDAATGKELLRFVGHTGKVAKAVFSPDGTLVVATGYDGTARVWDARTAQGLVTYTGHTTDEVNRVAFSPDGKTVVTSGEDGTARIWDPLTGKDVLVLRGHTANVAPVAFSPDGQWVLTGSYDGTARIWDATSGKELRRFTVAGEEVYAAAFSPDGKYIVTGGSDTIARLWDVQTGNELREFVGHSDSVRYATFSPNGKYLLTGSQDNTARLWRIN